MKKYLIKLSVFAAIVLGIIISVSVAVDPYNVFHYKYPVDNGIEANKNFIKTKYILSNPDEFDSLIFGSSRAGFVDVTQLNDGKYYNLCSSEAVPAEHLHLLKVLKKNGFVPENVLVFMDDISCFVDPATHENMLYRVPYPSGGLISHLKFYAKYCDLITISESLDVIRNYGNGDPGYTERYRENGSERLDHVSTFDGTNQPGFWSDYFELRLEECIAEIQELVDFCEENDIELRIVTNPLYYKTYAIGVENGYLDFLAALADVTEYYNFSGYSDVTTYDGNYYETSHFTAEVTRMMMDAVYHDWSDEALLSQGFGVKVTQENKDEVMNLLRGQAATQ